ncbi:MAG: ATP-binding cassette domain-containing protein [Schleiferiaceae bacterium]|jgi:ABC-type lipoprotein export system ATPase subunit|nr:ATP-binding cassette domain-containing protein [Schleiferiaceae bacterium]
MIEIRNLEFRYPKSTFHLRIDDLSLADTKSLTIVGPSGSGKTTLLQLISGIIPVQSGSIQVNRMNIEQLSVAQIRKWRAQNVGFVFQDFRLFEYMTLQQNILLQIQLSRKTTQSDVKRLQELASIAGISNLLNKKPKEVSQGEKQRAAILRAILHNPNLILADEPTGNLDNDTKIANLQLLLDMCRIEKSNLITVTHDLELLEHFDQILDFKTLKI